MLPKATQIDTEHLSTGLKLVGVEKPQVDASARPHSRLRPELRQAAAESWARNKEAYRYLGR